MSKHDASTAQRLAVVGAVLASVVGHTLSHAVHAVPCRVLTWKSSVRWAPSSSRGRWKSNTS